MSWVNIFRFDEIYTALSIVPAVTHLCGIQDSERISSLSIQLEAQTRSRKAESQVESSI